MNMSLNTVGWRMNSSFCHHGNRRGTHFIRSINVIISSSSWLENLTATNQMCNSPVSMTMNIQRWIHSPPSNSVQSQQLQHDDQEQQKVQPSTMTLPLDSRNVNKTLVSHHQQQKVQQLELALATWRKASNQLLPSHNHETDVRDQSLLFMDQPDTQARLQVASAYSNLGMFHESLHTLLDIYNTIIVGINNNNNKSQDNIRRENSIIQHIPKPGHVENENQQGHVENMNQCNTQSHTDTNSTTRAVVSSSSSFLPTHTSIASLLHSIGATYFHLQQYQEAQHYLQIALQMKQDIYDPLQKFIYHSEIGKTLHVLAIVQLLHVQEKRNKQGKVHPSQKSSLQKQEEEEEDDEDDSIPQKILYLLQQAEMHYRFHGMDHSSSSNNNNNNDTSPHFYSMQEQEENDHIIPTTTRNTNRQQQELATVLENMATLHRNYHDYNKALSLFQQVYDIRKSVLKITTTSSSSSTFISSPTTTILHDDESTLAITCLDIGDLLLALDRSDEAMDKYQEALHYHSLCIQKEYHNDDDTKSHQGTAMQSVLYYNIGKIHAEQGRFELAMDHYQKALQIRKSLLQRRQEGDYGKEQKDEEESHPEIASVYNAIGALLATKPGVQEVDLHTALSYFRQAYSMYEKCYEEDGDSLFIVDESILDQIQKNIKQVERLLHGTTSSFGLLE